MELFYREKASPDLIGMDDFGRFRDKIYLYERLTNARADAFDFKDAIKHPNDHKITRARVEVLKDRRVGSALLGELLMTTALFKNGKFLGDVEYSTGDFDKFVARSLQLKRYVEGQFGIATRRDIATKPIQHLDQLLSLVGLENMRTRKKKSGSKTTYFYRIDPTSLSVVQSVCKRRQEIKAWEFVNQLYGFE